MTSEIKQLKQLVWRHYRRHGRDLPWRSNLDPYAILVSEVMLQQTQVARVAPKFVVFLKTFPSFAVLAKAPTSEVLRLWQGLGYNRRALTLHRLAKIVVEQHAGKLPNTISELVALPGIGPNTAGAIRAYAFNEPAVFIETNIRTVFLHHFFARTKNVSDKKLLPYMVAALDTKKPRAWYWALMDYGAHLKATIGNQNQRSKHYAKQSPFAGSHRQLRGAVLKIMLTAPLPPARLASRLGQRPSKIKSVLAELQHEGFF